jgi:tetratricopeptide (TPR) repeat protein
VKHPVISAGPARVILLAALATAVFVFSCRTALLLGRDKSEHETLITRLLGSGRLALSDHCYRMSDVYFHRGGFGRSLERRERTDWFARVHDLMYERKHLHLEGDDTRDVLPWLQLATLADPHNIEPYLVASFCLRQLGDVAAAHRILAEARSKNPAAAEIPLEIGRLFLSERRYDQAHSAFSLGLALQDKSGETNEQAVYTTRTALLYKGLLEELRDDRGNAVRSYARVLEAWPENTAIRHRYEALLNGTASTHDAGILRFLQVESGNALESHFDGGEDHDHEHQHDHDHDHDHAHEAAPRAGR